MEDRSAGDFVAIGIVGRDPIAASELTAEEIDRCSQDATARLAISVPDIPTHRRRTGPRYTPVAKRQNRPEAISWLLKYQPELTDAQVCRLVGTTKPTINSVRDRTHWNTPNINPTDPVSLGMCTQTDLDTAIQTAVTRMRRKEERDRKTAAKKQREKDAASFAAAGGAAGPTPVGGLVPYEEAPLPAAIPEAGLPAPLADAEHAAPAPIETAPADDAPAGGTKEPAS